jgi:hypothetical protein
MPFSSLTACWTSVNAQEPSGPVLESLILRLCCIFWSVRLQFDIRKEKVIKLKGLKKVAKKDSESRTSVVILHFRGIDIDNRNRIGILHIPSVSIWRL